MKIEDKKAKLFIDNANLSGSKIHMVNLSGTVFDDINMSKTKFTNICFSDIEICCAQMGGAYLHNIGLPPETRGKRKQRPLKFENCELNDSMIKNCNLSNVKIVKCDISGMKINGILVEKLLKK
jgi:uncharacterized protein YjbI with pentapeptide repeats